MDLNTGRFHALPGYDTSHLFLLQRVYVLHAAPHLPTPAPPHTFWFLTTLLRLPHHCSLLCHVVAPLVDSGASHTGFVTTTAPGLPAPDDRPHTFRYTTYLLLPQVRTPTFLHYTCSLPCLLYHTATLPLLPDTRSPPTLPHHPTHTCHTRHHTMFAMVGLMLRTTAPLLPPLPACLYLPPHLLSPLHLYLSSPASSLPLPPLIHSTWLYVLAAAVLAWTPLYSLYLDICCTAAHTLPFWTHNHATAQFCWTHAHSHHCTLHLPYGAPFHFLPPAPHYCLAPAHTILPTRFLLPLPPFHAQPHTLRCRTACTRTACTARAFCLPTHYNLRLPPSRAGSLQPYAQPTFCTTPVTVAYTLPPPALQLHRAYLPSYTTTPHRLLPRRYGFTFRGTLPATPHCAARCAARAHAHCTHATTAPSRTHTAHTRCPYAPPRTLPRTTTYRYLPQVRACFTRLHILPTHYLHTRTHAAPHCTAHALPTCRAHYLPATCTFAPATYWFWTRTRDAAPCLRGCARARTDARLCLLPRRCTAFCAARCAFCAYAAHIYAHHTLCTHVRVAAVPHADRACDVCTFTAYGWNTTFTHCTHTAHTRCSHALHHTRLYAHAHTVGYTATPSFTTMPGSSPLPLGLRACLPPAARGAGEWWLPLPVFA